MINILTNCKHLVTARLGVPTSISAGPPLSGGWQGHDRYWPTADLPAQRVEVCCWRLSGPRHGATRCRLLTDSVEEVVGRIELIERL
jgi:hypothetical protein